MTDSQNKEVPLCMGKCHECCGDSWAQWPREIVALASCPSFPSTFALALWPLSPSLPVYVVKPQQRVVVPVQLQWMWLWITFQPLFVTGTILSRALLLRPCFYRPIIRLLSVLLSHQHGWETCGEEQNTTLFGSHGKVTMPPFLPLDFLWSSRHKAVLHFFLHANDHTIP